MKLTTTQTEILTKAIALCNADDREGMRGADCAISHAALLLGIGTDADCAVIANAEKDFRPMGSISTWDYKTRAQTLAAALRFRS